MDNTETLTAPELPLTRACPYHPPAGYTDLRELGPVTKVRLYDGRTVWAVTSHASTRSLLTDPRLSVDPDTGDFPKLSRVLFLRRPHSVRAMRTLLHTDPPMHSQQRRAMVGSLTLRRVRVTRPALTSIADASLAALESGTDRSAELLDVYVKPLVAASMAMALGFPEADRGKLAELLYTFDPSKPLADYLLSLLDNGNLPEEGMLADLARQVAAGSLSRDDFTDFGTVLIVAGRDLTINTIGLGVVTLLAHPDELDRLRTGEVPWANAVEELLRFLTLTAALIRIATADIEVAGTTIKAGDGVVLLNPAANRDPAAFERPDELDVGRQVRNHVTFGFGIHQCIGQHVARLAVDVGLSRLFERFPALRLAVPVEEVQTRQGLIFGIRSLPVVW